MDLIIRNARLSTRPEDGPVDIGVENGRIAAIAPKLAAEGKEHDAGGGIVCAGPVTGSPLQGLGSWPLLPGRRPATLGGVSELDCGFDGQPAGAVPFFGFGTLPYYASGDRRS